MALVKTIVENSGREFVVKWTGFGSDTLTLASLVSANQTLSGSSAPSAAVASVIASIDGSGVCTVTRNAVEVLHVHDNFQIKSEEFGTFNENAGSDIVVNLASAGTLILKIKKLNGYSDI